MQNDQGNRPAQRHSEACRQRISKLLEEEKKDQEKESKTARAKRLKEEQHGSNKTRKLWGRIERDVEDELKGEKRSEVTFEEFAERMKRRKLHEEGEPSNETPMEEAKR